MVDESPAQRQQQRKQWWFGRLGWGVLLLVQLLIYAHCSKIAWLTHDLNWVAWVVASVSLPMLVMRRVLPPSVLAANSKLLLVVSIALTLAGWLVFSTFSDLLGTTVVVTLGAFSLGFAIWLTMMGMQGVGAAATRVHISTALDGRVLAEAMRRPQVLLSLAMVMLVSAGVVHGASVLPLLSEPLLNSSSGLDVVIVMSFFWVGGALGGVSRLSEWEPVKLRSVLLAVLLIVATALAAVLSHWPRFLIGLPALVFGYVWVRTLREAGEILRADLQRSLRRRIPSWLLTWSGAGALLAGLLGFSLMRWVDPGSWGAWLRGGLPMVILLLGAAAVTWTLRREPRTSTGGGPGRDLWFDFPSLELAPYEILREDAQVIEIAYDIPDQNRAEFFEAMAQMEQVRMEEGAVWWTLSGDADHSTVFHEFFRIESWFEYKLALTEEGEAARLIKQRAFAANDWDTLPAEIHYPVHSAEAPAELASSLIEPPLVQPLAADTDDAEVEDEAGTEDGVENDDAAARPEA